MKRTCPETGTEFIIAERDLDFYERISPRFAGERFLVPPPTLSPDARERRRLAFRNERKLYYRNCSFTRKRLVSVYSPEKQLTVYDQEIWWSDRWDGRDFGTQFDFARPFFPQFGELLRRAPLINVSNTLSENSEYTHNASRNKNCYLAFCCAKNEDCLYCYLVYESRNCVDCGACRNSELCYECLDCNNCYSLRWSQNCRGCSDGAFLYNCSGCTHSLGCVNLRNKSYYFLNQPLSKADFEARYREITQSRAAAVQFRNEFEAFRLTQPHPWAQQQLCENCTGEYIYESRDIHYSFDVKHCEEVSYSQCVIDAKSCYDVTHFGLPGEMLYECNNVGIDAYNCLFSSYGYGNRDVLYCYNCHYCSNCFGCASLHHREYCVFNIQYSPEEYERVVATIIHHMESTKEWGEFFPIELSPFAYNETVANDFFPITESEARKQGLRWHEEIDAPELAIEAVSSRELKDSFGETKEEIFKRPIFCAKSRRPFRLVPHEIDFYRTHHLPIPTLHPDERYQERMKKRAPRRLYERRCAVSGHAILSSFAPSRPERVVSEEVYLRLVAS